MTVPSSLVVMVPSPSLSNREKASLNSVRAQEEKILAIADATKLILQFNLYRKCVSIAKDGKVVLLYCSLTCNLLFC